MATQEMLTNITVPASGDLSGSQFRFVDVNSDGQVVVASAGGTSIGVLQNKPAAQDRAATVAVAGVAKVVAGSGGLTAGAQVTPDASGGAVAAAATDNISGRAMQSAAEGELAPIFLQKDGVVPGT